MKYKLILLETTTSKRKIFIQILSDHIRKLFVRTDYGKIKLNFTLILK